MLVLSSRNIRILLLPPANVVCEGYVFTHVYHSFCSQGGVPDKVPPDQVQPPNQVHPPDQVHPPGPGAPPGTRYTPRTRYTPQDQVQPPRPGTPPGTRYTPQDQVHPPGPSTPSQDQVHPLEQSMLGDTVNVRAVRILLEYNFVSFNKVSFLKKN